MKKILLTGATGFLGSHLLEMLISESNNYDIAIVTREYRKTIPDIVEQIIIRESYKEFEDQLVNFQPEIVVHLASFLTARDDYEVLDNIIEANISFGTRLLQSLSKTNFKHFINTGSFAEYYWNDGALDSAYLYAATKTAFRHVIDYFSNKLKFNYVNVIPYTIYGEGDRNKKVIDLLIESLNREEAIKMTTGLQVLDFIHVNDVAKFYMSLIDKLDSLPEAGIDYHVGTGVGTSIKSLSKMIEGLSGKKPNITWGACENRPRDVMRAVAHISKPCQTLNWKPSVNLEDGLKIILLNKGINCDSK